jgi:hypothetical protein
VAPKVKIVSEAEAEFKRERPARLAGSARHSGANSSFGKLVNHKYYRRPAVILREI